MKLKSCAIIFSLLLGQSWGEELFKFPSWFQFGAATSAYQIEGAWNVSDKGESMWDRRLHTDPNFIADGSTGDVTCDSYHQWQRDIEIAVELGLDVYRFSISWPRLLPTGFPNRISEDGKRYYNNLIDGLLEKGIEPAVTIYHFDLPQSLLDLGGWANPLIADWFSDYARVVYSLYADRVKTWMTINEPFAICDMGYSETHMPYLKDNVGQYICNKNVLIAHAKAWRIYDEEFKPRYHGKAGIVNIVHWLEPATPEDEESSNLLREYWEGRYAHPIYSKEGGWPKALNKFMYEKSLKEGLSRSRLPQFTPEEIELIRGTQDFYALNHYSTRLVRKPYAGEKIGIWPYEGCEELGLVMVSDPSWVASEASWAVVYPEGLRRLLHWLKDTYGVAEIIVTENGYLTSSGSLTDPERMGYLKGSLEAVLQAIEEGVRVSAYMVWSLMDNFEWLGGLSTKFGIYSVNFTDPLRTRTPRDSARYYATVAKTRTLHATHVINEVWHPE